MAIQYVNLAHGSNETSGLTVASDAASHTTGNLIVALVGDSNGGGVNVSGITDTAGNTYTYINKQTSASGQVEIWYAKNIAGNANNILTATYASNQSWKRIYALQFSGCDTTAPYDVSNVGTGTGTAAETAPAQTTVAAEVIVGWFTSVGGTATAGSGFTLLDANYFYEHKPEYRIVSATGNYTAPMTVASGVWAGVHATFKSLVVIADLTGTAMASITEADIVTGGKTVIITLTNDTWISTT